MSLEYISTHYRVPARRGAPVKFEGRPGRVVGADGPHVLVRLDGEQEALPCHPTWNMTWDEETGPATRVPTFPSVAAPTWLGLEPGEPQWSGV